MTRAEAPAEGGTEPKWQRRLQLELNERGPYSDLGDDELAEKIRSSRLTSTNFDTGLALDWPHYCVGATEGCGGKDGWCYTFQGRLAGRGHHRKVALNDVAARRLPAVFAETVAAEVSRGVDKGVLQYPNLRYSGSGEVAPAHVPALEELVDRGVHLWGFSRRTDLLPVLTRAGVAVIFSCDRTTPPARIDAARALGVGLAYTSMGVSDTPPVGTVVTFPLHRSGKVAEVVDSASNCPKVLQEFFEGRRSPGTCQSACHRCHLTP